MPAISVAKALKLKNRLAGRLATVESNASMYNTVLAEQVGQVDVAALLKEREEIKNQLIKLKTNLLRVNNPIHELIVRQGELRASVTFLKTINTTDGVIRHGYQNTEMKYTAYLKKKDVDEQVRAAEKEINDIQDKLDEFNHTTRFEVEQRALDLAS